MASITEHVIKLQELTQKNLELLQSLNDSFFTDQSHLSVKVGDNQYAIPSFISLENRINSLAANFENLVNAPENGEAFFDFNGNSKAIQVRSYTSTPNSLVLDPVTEFKVDQNDIFKDFLTPNPYIHLNTQSLPNDITQVMVKKIIPINSELKQLFKSFLVTQDGDKTIHKTSIQYNYKDLYKVLDLYKQDIDYIEYDTKTDLPIRKNIGSGVYVIEEIIEDVVDDNLDNYITIKFRSDVNDPTIMSSLKYRLFDETIEKMLKVGDELVTYEGNAKMQIVEVRTNTNTIKVKVLHGDFLNLVPSSTNNPLYIPALSKIKFYSPIDFNEDKYVKVPLEEDQYIFVAIAALNSRMNVQSAWGGGIMLDTYALKNNNVDFKTYYDENVKNVGDVLFEITTMMSNTLTKYTKDEYDEFTQFIPTINEKDLQVVRINNHLNDSAILQKIHSLYTQKTQLQTDLEDIQNQINDTNEVLSAISFNDVNGQRSIYENNLSALLQTKNDIITSINKIVREISSAANDSETPIENAKYRIRGFFDISDIKWSDHIKGIRVQYRYKNVNTVQNKALTIDDKFLFSDWNDMDGFDRNRIPVYENGIYKSMMEPKNDNVNEPSFNQIDIPISQGETVDVRLKVVYDFGAPFVQTTSKWSPIINIKFPEEFLKSVEVQDILNEVNDEIETNKITNIIKDGGITDHISDKLVDQSIIYYHKPENIASGFYTAERRIIPLKDKLTELDNLITQLKDEIYANNSDLLTVSIVNSNDYITLTPLERNNIFTESYSSLMNEITDDQMNTNSNSVEIGNYIYNKLSNSFTTVMYLSLCNNSNHTVKLFSMFPGSRDTSLDPTKSARSKFDINDYAKDIIDISSDSDESKLIPAGVWFMHPAENEFEDSDKSLQSYNQFIYFRINDITTGDDLYMEGNTKADNNLLSLDKNYFNNIHRNDETALCVYPKLNNKYGLCFDSKTHSDYLLVNPKENIMIPIVVEFKFSNTDINDNDGDYLWKTDNTLVHCCNCNGEEIFLRKPLSDFDKERAYKGLNSNDGKIDYKYKILTYKNQESTRKSEKFEGFKSIYIEAGNGSNQVDESDVPLYYAEIPQGETAETFHTKITVDFIKNGGRHFYLKLEYEDNTNKHNQNLYNKVTWVSDPSFQKVYTKIYDASTNKSSYHQVGDSYLRRSYANKYYTHYGWKTSPGSTYPNIQEYKLCEDNAVIPQDTAQYVEVLNANGNNEFYQPYSSLYYVLVQPTNVNSSYIQKTMSFDIWPSLYKDPINYKFTITSKVENSIYDTLLANQQTKFNEANTEYIPIFK